jgi:hypothetical protein
MAIFKINEQGGDFLSHGRDVERGGLRGIGDTQPAADVDELKAMPSSPLMVSASSSSMAAVRTM